METRNRNKEMTTLEQRIEDTISKIIQCNDDIQWYQKNSRLPEIMVKAETKKRAGLRGHLTRLQKQAGLI